MKYDFRYDIIRATAIILVICIHSMGMLNDSTDLGKFTTLIKAVYDSTIYIGVPLFVMLSGALLLGKDEPLKIFFNKRLKRILIPFLLWSTLVYAILHMQDGGRSIIGYITSFISKTLGEGVYGIYWYIYLILGLYLITPLLRKMFINGNGTIACYAAFIPITFHIAYRIFPQCSLMSRFACENLLYIGYFIAGYAIATYLKDNHRIAILSKYLLALIVVMNIVIHLKTTNYLLFDFMTILTSLLMFTSIITTKKLKVNSSNEPLLIKVVKFISNGSYCIYLTHFMIISIMVKFSFMKTFPLSIEPLVMCIIVLFAECIMIAILKRCKFNKYLM